MLDININFSNLFAGCLGSNSSSNSNEKIKQLKQAIKRTDKPTQIQLILGKITDDGKYHSSFLFTFTSENAFEITDFFGPEEHQKDSQLLCRNIPLLKRNKIVSVLCVRSEKFKPIIVDEGLIELLTDIVIGK